jgi:hypothetical protein
MRMTCPECGKDAPIRRTTWAKRAAPLVPIVLTAVLAFSAGFCAHIAATRRLVHTPAVEAPPVLVAFRDATPDEIEEGERLFREGKALEEEGKLHDASAKYEAMQKQFPGTYLFTKGTMCIGVVMQKISDKADGELRATQARAARRELTPKDIEEGERSLRIAMDIMRKGNLDLALKLFEGISDTYDGTSIENKACMGCGMIIEKRIQAGQQPPPQAGPTQPE